MSKKNLIKLSTLLSLILSTHGLSTAQVVSNNSTQIVQISSLEHFKPRPQNKRQIDYNTLNSLLEEMVLYTGPSTRKRMSQPQVITGTLILRGHKSAYRMEGSRIPYSGINDKFEAFITSYREDLEKAGAELNIPELPKNEQLAYWLNLHNVVMIEQLSKAYPVRTPNKLKIGSPRVPLQDAKIIKIGNSVLSLRDIREKIVYPNWSNPKVIYGFYLGDIGSPSIQNQAFNANNLSDLLDRNATEFINSLRGFHVRNGKQYVSKIYEDLSQFYFQDFDTDIADHVRKFMRDDVKVQMTGGSFKIDRYDDMIADITAGQGNYESISPMASTLTASPNTLSQYIREIVAKRKTLIEEGLMSNGTVIIEDLEKNDGPYVPAPDIDAETEK